MPVTLTCYQPWGQMCEISRQKNQCHLLAVGHEMWWGCPADKMGNVTHKLLVIKWYAMRLPGPIIAGQCHSLAVNHGMRCESASWKKGQCHSLAVGHGMQYVRLLGRQKQCHSHPVIVGWDEMKCSGSVLLTHYCRWDLDEMRLWKGSITHKL